MATGINFSGISTGIDTEGIIARLKEIGKRPVILYQQQQVKLKLKQTAWQEVNTRLLALQTAAKSLADPTALSVIKGAVGDDKVASIEARTTAATGEYDLEVIKKAQGQRLATDVFADVSSPLNLAGDVLINGKTISIVATDSLGAVAGKINASGAGVNASLLTVGPGEVRMTLSSNTTGKQSALAISSAGADGVAALARLGLVDPASVSTRYTSTKTETSGGVTSVTDTAHSLAFADTSKTLNALLGLSSASTLSGTFTVGGKAVSYDTSVDTLESLVGKIKDGGLPAGVSGAELAGVTSGGASSYEIQVSGTGGQPVFGGDTNVLNLIGLTSAAPARAPLQDAQDAEFKLEGFTFFRPTNTVTDALSDVTINLLKTNAGAPTTVTLSRDSEAAGKAVNDFVAKYNEVAGFIKEQFTYNPEAPTSTPLGGNLQLQQIQSDLALGVTDVVPGLSADANSLAAVGVSLGSDGTLSVDDAKLNAALAKDPDAVSRLFTTVGQASSAGVRFLLAGDKVQESGPAGYAVQVDRAATQATAVSGRAMGAETLAAPETLTFSGDLFGNAGTSVTLEAGLNLDGIISRINNDARFNRSLVAFKDPDTNALAFKALAYGSGGSFTVVSDTASGAGSTGIDTTILNRVGVDVAGRIGGEEATGSGQTLTGKAGNARTDGLSVIITGTELGGVGTVTVSRGVASRTVSLLSSLTDFTDGIVPGLSKSVQEQIDEIGTAITNMNDRLNAYEEQLRKQFTAMEAQVSRLQAVGAQLSQQIAGMTSSNKSGDN
uniref:Flagellar hook-associated protein 2 n=1 Tax=uncultured Armatimonadetes bacterium TaxID=157466 RepID=A0A6J4JZ61_9BACT|nr:hypothetical protein AVDCRST_MAG63-4360 [uncultured Armatimonadetes bacterium]